MKVRALVGFGILAVLAGCGSKSTGATCPTGSTLTYDNFGRQFMTTYCTGCHGTGGRAPNLSTVAGVRAERGEIDQTAAAGPNGVNTTFPRGAPCPRPSVDVSASGSPAARPEGG